MKTFSKDLLSDQKVTWVKPGQSIPFMQGMALNRLALEYPTKNKDLRQGYFIYNPGINNKPLDDLAPGCYYLIERRTILDSSDQKVVVALAAFRENGDSIEGVALFI